MKRNSTQLKATLHQLALELDLLAHPTHQRKLKFGTDTHQTNLIKIP